ncbi:ATP-binding cassette domain-containing protein [Mesonia aestuariivivens]|uniref:ATP-binding cassette domain-containing protein n=1 Tax=Mesonia aestuariivivens TaxID=2796128 RepID=A0ABS6W768_9FLAO|nr:ATP-binding cassette domain-containing protein [Mesonia aestuariivivens]MBW2962969.1 ATP-binding cassette domain-containing protein [Mesonia aestuariivivens]
MRLKNAYQNNLKNVSLDLPENQLIVVTGLSGSGKSSLAMGVIANEGYRYFLESLPAYHQQNSMAIPTAEVDAIEDLPPVVKVEQSKRFQSIKATFGTLSELAPMFRVLFARYSAEEKMSKSLFSFNHPKGACEQCRGIGEEEYIDLEKLIGDENKTLREGAIVTTLPNGYIVYSQVTVEELNKVCKAHRFNVDTPWKELSQEQKDVILYGSDRLQVFYGKHSIESRLRWQGFKAKPREEGYYKGVMPIMENILRLDRNKSILRFVSARTCPKCHGARIKAAHLKFTWQGFNFQEWMELPLAQLYDQLQSLSLSEGEQLLVEKLSTQLFDLIRLGMEHYTLSTPSHEISSGDAQRIKLIKQVNSHLQGILYVFDEPSIGLSAAYQKHLLHILRRLILRGNTVMVVEHDLAFMKSADWLVELGPGAGVEGGEILFNGKFKDFITEEKLSTPTRKAFDEEKEVSAKEVVTESLINFQPKLQGLSVVSRKTKELTQKVTDFCTKNEFQLYQVDDQPIGKTPRSNPSTYTGLADKIRDLLAKTPQAKEAKLTKSDFSFNNKSGRCPHCEGAGVITLSMSVMGSVNQTCPHCQGKRFQPKVLKVTWHKKNISDIYELSVTEAHAFFAQEQKLVKILSLMQQLGLGYLKLGQASNTLSGGEAQRIKLTKHFIKSAKKTLLWLEEPSIGLHQQNVKQLLTALQQLKAQTAGIICIENHELFQQEADTWVNNTKKVSLQSPQLPTAARQEVIAVTGASTHALKELNLEFPKQQLSVVTGISGSGKSSLVIDTLHGYGLQEMTKQFSSYQQSRVGVNFQLEVAHIEGLTPSICISRKEKNFTERSDIAKQTDIDKTLRFAFSRKAQYEGKDWTASHFSNQHELGKCIVCDGLGEEQLPDPPKLVLAPQKSIAEGVFTHNKALAYYGSPTGQYMAILKEVGKVHGFDLQTPFKQFTKEQVDIIFNGVPDQKWQTVWEFKTKTRTGTQELNRTWDGLFSYLKEEYVKTRKNKHIKALQALLSSQRCSHCQGSGLQPERLTIHLGGKSIHDLKTMNFKDFTVFLNETSAFPKVEKELVARMQAHLKNTLARAEQLHIDYLQLNRKSKTLSGGEQQRVALIKQLNSPLQGVTYLLDEPSAGLSQDNIPDLIQLLKELVAKGNTVIVIEHHKDIILAAKQLYEIGPKAGELGGELMFQGSPQDYLKTSTCHPFLKAPSQAVVLKPSEENIHIKQLHRHRLKKESLQIPIGGITAITGKSGVGKTTLVKEILMPSITQGVPVNCEAIKFPASYTGVDYFEPQKLSAQHKTLVVDYLNLLPVITQLFAKETHASASYFSYKNKSSQCANCKGTGVVETSLDVVANSVEVCEVCEGTRYQKEVLNYQLNHKNIAEVLAFSLEELWGWLPPIKSKASVANLIPQLLKIGLGHIRLDQGVTTLSSGEKQRLLLLNWLQQKQENQLYILDEPSTGLHYADIDLLFEILQQLSKTNDVLVIDHNPYLLLKIGVGIALQY